MDLTVVPRASGGYSASEPAHITISSSDPSYRGYAALEMLFHEGSHGFGLLAVLIEPLNQAAAEQKVTVPPQLWHAVLFYTAGELTTRELKARGIDYTPYADAGFYDRHVRRRLPRQDRRALDAASRRQALDPDALSALVAAFK